MIHSRLVSRLLPVFLVPALYSCSWVKLDEAGENVALIPGTAAEACQRIGKTTATSREKVGILNRGDKKVALEVLNLAKNSAAEMGGNAIVEEGELTNGKQVFVVYRCP